MLTVVLLVSGFLFSTSHALECTNTQTLENGECVDKVVGGYTVDTEDIADWLDPTQDGGWSRLAGSEGRRETSNGLPEYEWVPPASINWNPLDGDQPVNGFIRSQGFCAASTIYAVMTELEIWANLLEYEKTNRDLYPASEEIVCSLVPRLTLRTKPCANNAFSDSVLKDSEGKRLYLSQTVELKVLDERTFADCVDPIQESAGVGGWKKVEVIDDLYKGKQGYVSNEYIKNCVSPNTHKIALDVQNQLHCLSYEQSDTVCKGNSYNEVVAMVRDIQQHARIENQSSGVVSPINGDVPLVNGAIVGSHADPGACQRSTSIDSRIPLLSPQYPFGDLEKRVVDWNWGRTLSWRKIFSPWRTQEVQGDVETLNFDIHFQKIEAMKRALTLGPFTMSVVVCGDFKYDLDEHYVITFQGCPSADKLDDEALAAQNIYLVRVTVVGYEHAAQSYDAPHWLVQLAWGAGWGNQGFARLAMDRHATPYYGYAAMLLTRPHDSIFNPLLPKWNHARLRLGDGSAFNKRASSTEGSGTACTTTEGVCSWESGSSLVLKKPSDLPPLYAFEKIELVLIKNNAASNPAPETLRFSVRLQREGDEQPQATNSVSKQVTWRPQVGKSAQSGVWEARVVLEVPRIASSATYSLLEVELLEGSDVGLREAHLFDIDDQLSASFRDEGVTLEDGAALVSCASLAALLALFVALF